MIKAKNLTKIFPSAKQNITIYKDLDLDVKKGEFISIVGPSGSGKSTLLNLISGIDRDYIGTLEIDGVDLNTLTDSQITNFRAKNISYIFQNFKLIENLTVRENVDLIVMMNKLERNFDTDEILKLVGLEDKKDTYVYNLSGGESQRVAVARAFVGKTKVLLADEPTGALDVSNKNSVMNLILDLHKKTNTTIVMITHDDEVAKKADKIYKLQDYNLK